MSPYPKEPSKHDFNFSRNGQRKAERKTFVVCVERIEFVITETKGMRRASTAKRRRPRQHTSWIPGTNLRIFLATSRNARRRAAVTWPNVDAPLSLPLSLFPLVRRNNDVFADDYLGAGSSGSTFRRRNDAIFFVRGIGEHSRFKSKYALCSTDRTSVDKLYRDLFLPDNAVAFRIFSDRVYFCFVYF